jgi:hypothetical protein
MERHAPATDPETTTSPDQLDLSFAEVDAIDDLRDRQMEAIGEVNNRINKSVTPMDLMSRFKVVQQRKREQSEAVVEDLSNDYLDSNTSRDQNPEAYDALKELFASTTVTQISTEKWFRGDRDADGNYIPGTSGREIAQSKLDALRAKLALAPEPTPAPAPTPASVPAPIEATPTPPATDETTPPPTPAPAPAPEPKPAPAPVDPPEIKPPKHAADDTQEIPVDKERLRLEQEAGQAIGRLMESRQQFAEISAQRSQQWRKRGSKPKKLEAEYLRLQEIYKRHEVEAGRAKALLDIHAGKSETLVRAHICDDLLIEDKKLKAEELDYLEKDQSLVARVGRKLAKGRRLGWLVGGTAVVAGASSTAVKGATGVALMAATPLAMAGIGGLAAIQTAKGALTATVGNRARQYKEFDKRAEEDYVVLEAFLQRFRKADGRDNYHEHVLGRGTQGHMDLLDTRVETDRKDNARRVITTTAIGGAAAAAGVGLGLLADHFDVGTHIGHGITKGWNHLTGHAGADGAHGASVNPIDQGTHPDIPTSHVVSGFHNQVTVKPGDGYQHLIHELAAQKHVNLTDRQSWELWHQMNSQFHGHIFSNDPSYSIGHGADNLGIAHATKKAVVNDDVLHWLSQNLPVHH